MNDIERNYRIAASAYQAQQPSYMHAATRRRTQTISDGDYLTTHNLHVDLLQALDHAEAIWIASWR